MRVLEATVGTIPAILQARCSTAQRDNSNEMEETSVQNVALLVAVFIETSVQNVALLVAVFIVSANTTLRTLYIQVLCSSDRTSL